MVETLIFDLDGTLYEHPGVLERYARELAALLPPDRRPEFLSAWERAKGREGAIRVGLGYDRLQDRLFRHGPEPVYLDWSGNQLADVLEGELVANGRFLIGDHWGLLMALAAHHGLSREHVSTAFLATRAAMRAEYPLRREPGYRELLADLRTAGKRLVLMSNSPADSVTQVVADLGVASLFSEIVPDGAKPEGLRRWLQTVQPPAPLSIGDHYVNDIQPALEAGGEALYIDRHETGLAGCHHVASIPEAIRWLRCTVLGERPEDDSGAGGTILPPTPLNRP